MVFISQKKTFSKPKLIVRKKNRNSEIEKKQIKKMVRYLLCEHHIIKHLTCLDVENDEPQVNLLGDSYNPLPSDFEKASILFSDLADCRIGLRFRFTFQDNNTEELAIVFKILSYIINDLDNVSIIDLQLDICTFTDDDCGKLIQILNELQAETFMRLESVAFRLCDFRKVSDEHITTLASILKVDDLHLRGCKMNYEAFFTALPKTCKNVNLRFAVLMTIRDVLLPVTKFIQGNDTITSFSLLIDRECFGDEQFSLTVESLRDLIFRLASCSNLNSVAITASDCFNSPKDCKYLGEAFEALFKKTSKPLQSLDLRDNKLDTKRASLLYIECNNSSTFRGGKVFY